VLGFQDYPSRNSRAHFYASYGATLNLVQTAHQPVDLGADQEIRQLELRPWPLVRVELYISQNHWTRSEYGFGMLDQLSSDASLSSGAAK
jgi:hypothetical protein